MPLLRRSSSTKFWPDQTRVNTPPIPSSPSDMCSTPDSVLKKEDGAEVLVPSIIYWPYNNQPMPSSLAGRAVWFLQQVARSSSSLPGAYITPRIFIPNQMWAIHVDSLCARQLSMRAALLESIARAIGDIEWTPKLGEALLRKIVEQWDHCLNLPTQGSNSPPSPPILDTEQFPGPVRLRRGPKSHFKSLVSRRSASPDRSPNDLLYQYSPANSLPKYVEAVESILAALKGASAHWFEFVIFTVVDHIVDDVLEVHERYMETVKYALLGLS